MLAGRTVLIVEDEYLIAEFLSDMVEDFGMVVCGVADTADMAADAAIEAHPDMVLMDVRLKGAKDGIDAAHMIHEFLRMPGHFHYRIARARDGVADQRRPSLGDAVQAGRSTLASRYARDRAARLRAFQGCRISAPCGRKPRAIFSWRP